MNLDKKKARAEAERLTKREVEDLVREVMSALEEPLQTVTDPATGDLTAPLTRSQLNHMVTMAVVTTLEKGGPVSTRLDADARVIANKTLQLAFHNAQFKLRERTLAKTQYPPQQRNVWQ